METVLDWLSGISWTLVYFIAIYLGIQKKTHCIPGVCISLNFSWEMWAVLTRVLQKSPLDSGFISQLMWLVVDIGVVYTWLRYATGTTLWRKCLLFSAVMVLMAVVLLGAGLWAEVAFCINLLMSTVFLFQVGGRVYPSLPIAGLKCLGTLSATILNGILHRNFLVLTIGGLCLLADLCYIYEVWTQKTQQNMENDRNGVNYETSICKIK